MKAMFGSRPVERKTALAKGEMTRPYDWDEARRDKGNIKGVLSLIGKGMSHRRGARKKGYPFQCDGRQRRKHVRYAAFNAP